MQFLKANFLLTSSLSIKTLLLTFELPLHLQLLTGNLLDVLRAGHDGPIGGLLVGVLLGPVEDAPAAFDHALLEVEVQGFVEQLAAVFYG